MLHYTRLATLHATDVFDWLRSVLVGFCPKDTPVLPADIKRAFMISIQRNEYITGREGSDTVSISLHEERISLQELERHLLEVPDSTPIVLKLAQGRYFKRPLSNKILPFSRAQTMARLDMDEHAPFLAEGTYVLFTESAVGTGTDYYIVRKLILDPVLEEVARSMHRVGAIRLQADDGDKFLSRASLRSVVPVSRGQAFRAKLLAGAVAALLALSVLTYAHAYMRSATAAARLTELVEFKQEKAMAVRKKLETRQQELQLLQAARAAKAEAVPVSALWEDLTRLLPDSTWLTDLTIRNEQVAITGFSSSAADLIAVLGASPLLSDPSFASPVMRVPGQQGERFSIQMRMKQN